MIPDQRDIGFRMPFVLLEAGGQMDFDHMVEVIGDHFHVNSRRGWAYRVRWTCTMLRREGFLERPSPYSRGLIKLTDAGRRLGECAKRFYTENDPEVPERAKAFLARVRGRIKRFVAGKSRHNPPDAELCRWIDLCYRLKDYDEGAALFTHVLKDRVPPSLYDRASRQARVCAQKAAPVADPALLDFGRTLYFVLRHHYKTCTERKYVTASQIREAYGEFLLWVSLTSTIPLSRHCNKRVAEWKRDLSTRIFSEGLDPGVLVAEARERQKREI